MVSTCCGCSLRTGSYFIGWYFTIIGGIAVVLDLIALKYVNSIVGHDEVKRISTITLGVILVFLLIHEGVNILLLVGIKKESTAYLKTWIIFMIIMTSLKFLFIIGYVLRGSQVPNDYGIRHAILMGVIGEAIAIYCTLMVTNYLHEVRDKPKPTFHPKQLDIMPAKQFV